MMEYEMKESLPKSWDKTKRVYEVSYHNGKKEIYKEEYLEDFINRNICLNNKSF